MRRVLLFALVLSVPALVGITTAFGLSCGGDVYPDALDLDLGPRGGGKGVGVYEQETVASAHAFLREPMTASVVTRYWGTPPAETGIQYEGGFWALLSYFGRNPDSDTCHPDGPAGTVGWGMVVAHDSEAPRQAPGLLIPVAVDGVLTPEIEAFFEEAYGPPVIVDQSPGVGAWAKTVMWGPSILLIAAVVGLTYGIIRYRARRSARSFHVDEQEASASR